MIKISKKNENISIPASDLRQELPETSFERVAGHNNMLYLIQLRWIAVIGQIITISVAVIGYGIPLPMSGILKVLACLIAFNIGSHLRWHEERVVTNYELFFALLIDVAGLTALLYFSGGISNPFAFLYLLQVVLSVVLLETWSTWSIVLITSICLTGLGIFSEPLVLPPNHSNNLNLYIQAMLICFVINAVLLVIFITRISNNLRARDTQLSQFRQRAAEEDRARALDSVHPGPAGHNGQLGACARPTGGFIFVEPYIGALAARTRQQPGAGAVGRPGDARSPRYCVRAPRARRYDHASDCRLGRHVRAHGHALLPT